MKCKCGAEIPLQRQLAIKMFGLRPVCIVCAEVEERPLRIDCGLEFAEAREVAQEVLGVSL
jgi:hypothetical protein